MWGLDYCHKSMHLFWQQGQDSRVDRAVKHEKKKKDPVKWGLLTIFCLLKNMFEETSDFFDTGDPKGEPLAGKQRSCF